MFEWDAKHYCTYILLVCQLIEHMNNTGTGVLCGLEMLLPCLIHCGADCNLITSEASGVELPVAFIAIVFSRVKVFRLQWKSIQVCNEINIWKYFCIALNYCLAPAIADEILFMFVTIFFVNSITEKLLQVLSCSFQKRWQWLWYHDVKFAMWQHLAVVCGAPHQLLRYVNLHHVQKNMPAVVCM